MLILVINCGSSSLKFKLIDTCREQIKSNDDKVLACGHIENIGEPEARIHYEGDSQPIDRKKKVENHKQALTRAIELLEQDGEHLESHEDLDAVGHRVVHGGELLSRSVLIDEEVKEQIEECIQFAPLHNPHNLAGIKAVEEEFPEKPQVAAFDTGIHQTLPEKAYRYAIPDRYYTDHGIRRYGFHGLSHRYLRMRSRQILGIDYHDIKVVTCHLGNGASLAAFDGIEVQDTSMGFTPLEGLVMGTRSGDIDPAVVTYIMSLEDFSREEIDRVLNKESGLLGLSGQTNNMKKILEEMEAGDEKCELAVNVFCHRLKKYISAYQGILNGAHAIVFSGGIGENAAEIRRRSSGDLQALGIEIDEKKNEQTVGEEKIISTEGSPTEVMVIPTNEELMIARDTARCLEKD